MKFIHLGRREIWVEIGKMSAPPYRKLSPKNVLHVFPPVETRHGKLKTKAFVDGRWTLAFRDEESCKSALSMILEEINFLSDEVHRRLKPLLNLETALDLSGPEEEDSSSHSTTPPNSV